MSKFMLRKHRSSSTHYCCQGNGSRGSISDDKINLLNAVELRCLFQTQKDRTLSSSLSLLLSPPLYLCLSLLPSLSPSLPLCLSLFPSLSLFLVPFFSSLPFSLSPLPQVTELAGYTARV